MNDHTGSNVRTGAARDGLAALAVVVIAALLVTLVITQII